MATLHSVHISAELLAELQAKATAEGKTVVEATLRESLSEGMLGAPDLALSGSEKARAIGQISLF